MPVQFPDNYTMRLASLESGMDPRAQNPNSSAKGLFQFIDSTAQAYGLDDPFDPQKSLDAVQRFTADNRARLKAALGREPTEGELYLAHQQGADGAIKLLSNPTARAADLVGADAIKLNAGSQDMTAQDFAGKWINKFEGQGDMATDLIDVELPDGTLVEGVPANISKTELVEKLKKNGLDVSGLEQQPAATSQPAEQPQQPQSQPTADDARSSTALTRTPKDDYSDIGSGTVSALRRLGSAARSGFQGLTFGAGDEIQAGLAALPVSALTSAVSLFNDNVEPITPGQAYDKALKISRDELKQIREDYPIQSIISEIGGGIVTGGATKSGLQAAAPKTMSALSRFAAANPVKAAAGIGAGTGGLYGFNEGEGGALERLESGGYGAAFGGAGGAVGGYVGSKFGNRGAAVIDDLAQGGDDAGRAVVPAGGRALARTGQGSLPTSEGLRSEAGNLYKEASKVGGRLKPQATEKLLNDLSKSVAPKNRVEAALKGENVIAKAADDLGIALKDGASFDELHSLEKMLGELANENVVATTGKLNAVGQQFKEAQKQLRSFIDNIPEDQFDGGKLAFDLKKAADKKWAQSLKLNEVEKVMTRASLQEQPSTGLRSGFRTILANPNKTRNYSPEELKVMRQAAELDLPTSALRAMGSRLVPTFAAGGTAATGFNPVALAGTAALYGGSALARKAANARQLGKAEALARLIENPNALKVFADPRIVGGAGVSGGVIGGRTGRKTEEELDDN